MASQEVTGTVRVGTAGWSIPREFADAIPGDGKHLDRYARTFTCCEVNSSFHRRHTQKAWARWRDLVPKEFKFSVKAPKTITHEAKLLNVGRLLEEFFADISALEHTLGPVLFQLPPKLTFEIGLADDFFDEVREMFAGDVACEPRHASWFEQDAEQLLERHHIARVAADPPRVPPAEHPGGWSGLRYYRLHGSPRMYYSPYTSEYLEKLATEFVATTSPAWCIFDNTASGAAMGNALHLQRVMRETMEWR